MSARGGMMHAAAVIGIGLVGLLGKMGAHSGSLVRGTFHEAGAIGRGLERSSDDIAAGFSDGGRIMPVVPGTIDDSGRLYPNATLHDTATLERLAADADPAAARPGGVSGADDSLHSGAAFDHPISVAAQQLDDTRDIRTPAAATQDVFVVAPVDRAEAGRIFLSSANPRFADRAVRDAGQALDTLGPAAHRGANATEMLAAIERSDKHYISIIGHNQDGKIIFADGSLIDLRYLSKRCKQLDKFCIMLSCKSHYAIDPGGAGMHVQLTYQDAAFLSGRIDRIMQRSPNGVIAPADIERQLRVLLRSADVAIAAADAVKIAYIPTLATGTAVMIVSASPD